VAAAPWRQDKEPEPPAVYSAPLAQSPMPGIFGTVGVSPEQADLLSDGFLRCWPGSRVERADTARVGGHAFGGKSAVRRFGEGGWLGVDGEWSIYAELEACASNRSAHASIARGEWRPASAGNVTFLDPDRSRATIAVDASGTFPLYYTEHAGGLLFSSLLRPLALAVEAGRDDLATLEFLRQGYMVGGKTPFKGVHRLLPGQRLRYARGEPTVIDELSVAWAGKVDAGRKQAADRLWSDLQASLDRALPGSSALMMSGGWDSRTLLAAATSSGRQIQGYSHGDVEGRELRLVRRLCDEMQVSCRLEPIDDRVLDPDVLRQGFERTENVVFPHWHHAGQILAEGGMECAMAGVYGEVMGGHYGPAMMAGTRGKIRAVGGTLLGFPPSEQDPDGATAAEFLRVPAFGHHWYLDREWEQSLDRPRERMNADIEMALNRLDKRGVRGEITRVEAFVSEHRGTQYINAQLLSCRARLDVALPYAGEQLLTLASRIPLSVKIHNALNREMLARHSPRLLKYPMAATLVPAGAPLLLQEASRFGRRSYESVMSRLSDVSQGRIPRPRLGWVDFRFLRDSQRFERLAQSLRSDIWDREGIERRVRAIASGDAPPELIHPIYDQFMKIYTVDLRLHG
jgi:hypothetical protein